MKKILVSMFAFSCFACTNPVSVKTESADYEKPKVDAKDLEYPKPFELQGSFKRFYVTFGEDGHEYILGTNVLVHLPECLKCKKKVDCSGCRNSDSVKTSTVQYQNPKRDKKDSAYPREFDLPQSLKRLYILLGEDEHEYIYGTDILLHASECIKCKNNIDINQVKNHIE